MGHGGRPWVRDFNDPNYLAGRAAMKRGNSPFDLCNIEPGDMGEGGILILRKMRKNEKI